MARMIRIGHTVLDLLDVWMEHSVLEDAPIKMVALNKFEWNQLLKLHGNNFNNCTGVITLVKDNALLYKDLFVYYDGTENTDSDYMYHMEEMRDQIRRIRNRMENRMEAEDGPPTLVGRRISREIPRPQYNPQDVAFAPVAAGTLGGSATTGWNTVQVADGNF